VAPGLGPAAAALAVLRRRLVTRDARPDETLAIALLVGAGCRRLSRNAAIALAVCGGVAMTAAPVLRYGVGSSMALLAVPAALLWGGSLALGLILRDADDRRFAALAEVRTAERLRLARELHDFVAHHVTGIVVRAQAARMLAERPDTAGPDAEVYREIEVAGSDALTAMRRLVGMLRTDAPDPSPSAAGIRAADRPRTGGRTRRGPRADQRRDLRAPGHLAVHGQDSPERHPAQARRPQPDRDRHLGLGEPPGGVSSGAAYDDGARHHVTEALMAGGERDRQRPHEAEEVTVHDRHEPSDHVRPQRGPAEDHARGSSDTRVIMAWRRVTTPPGTVWTKTCG
jgi:hypothetical protein